jgi:hypothetical protein
MMWVMMRAMMWATGTMAATTPATTPVKEMASTPVGRGGGAPGGGCGGGSGSSGGSGDGGGCILQGSLLFIVKIFLCGIFIMCGGIGEVTPPLTLSSRLRYVGVLLGGDGNCPQKLLYHM